MDEFNQRPTLSNTDRNGICGNYSSHGFTFSNKVIVLVAYSLFKTRLSRFHLLDIITLL